MGHSRRGSPAKHVDKLRELLNRGLIELTGPKASDKVFAHNIVQEKPSVDTRAEALQ